MVATTHERPRGIITPEAVVLEFETASVASRLLARLLDGVILWFGLVGVAMFLGVTGPIGSEAVAIIFVVILLFFLIFGYWMLFETLLGGRTLGKMALGLRVVTIEGAPVRFRHSAIRAIVGVVDFLLPPLGPVAVVSVLVSANDQRLGDLAAGTIVLRERIASESIKSIQLTEPTGKAQMMGSLQLARMSEGQYNLIRRYLLRTPTLSSDARSALAMQLAEAVERETGVDRPTDLHPEWYLHAAGLAHQRRSGLTTTTAVASTGSIPPASGGSPVATAPPPPPPPPSRPVV